MGATRSKHSDSCVRVIVRMSGCLHYIAVLCLLVISVASQTSRFNPSIIQDSRLEPKADGTFGFQYRTEDGISHAAQGDPTGFIQGTYSYKDPTGLKVNFNYFAGNRATTQPQYNNPPPPQQYYRQQESPQYPQAPEPYRPRTRPPASYLRPQYDSGYNNEVYDSNEPQYTG